MIANMGTKQTFVNLKAVGYDSGMMMANMINLIIVVIAASVVFKNHIYVSISTEMLIEVHKAGYFVEDSRQFHWSKLLLFRVSSELHVRDFVVFVRAVRF